MSERTLQRRLKDEGVTFAALVDEVRPDLARMYLADPKLAIFEVAFLLGYSEPSAFNRAFRRWTGTSPSDFRSKPANGRGRRRRPDVLGPRDRPSEPPATTRRARAAAARSRNATWSRRRLPGPGGALYDDDIPGPTRHFVCGCAQPLLPSTLVLRAKACSEAAAPAALSGLGPPGQIAPSDAMPHSVPATA